MPPTLDIDLTLLNNTAEIYRALSHPLRLAILDFIDKNGRINVNKIYTSLELEQSITSQHLRILRLANLVSTQRDGKHIFYEANYATLKNIQQAKTDYLKPKK